MKDWEELQADVPDGALYDLTSELRCAESCETVQDFRASVTEALDRAETIVARLRDIKRELGEP